MNEVWKMSKKLKIWFIVSIILAIAGAVMLYPVGAPSWNIIFVIIKAGMVTGLLIMVLAGKTKGFKLWALCSGGAVVMTILKWITLGGAAFLMVGSIFVDIFMPAMAWHWMRQEGWTPEQL